MIHLYYTYSVSKLPYRRAFISATSNREFLPDFLKISFFKLFLFALKQIYPIVPIIKNKIANGPSEKKITANTIKGSVTFVFLFPSFIFNYLVIIVSVYIRCVCFLCGIFIFFLTVITRRKLSYFIHNFFFQLWILLSCIEPISCKSCEN